MATSSMLNQPPQDPSHDLSHDASHDPSHTPSPTDPPTPRLQVRGLVSRYGGPFDLTLSPGECVAVVGRSGSGKSVLLRLIADLDPHEGEVSLDGRPCTSWPAPAWRGQVVYQAAEPAWWAATARAHFAATEAASLVGLLARLGLDPALLDADIARLSTGERQRMALVRSLVGGPQVVLLDEPTASLDQASTLAVEALLAEHLGAGLSAIVVTHSREQAGRIAHHVLELREHRLHALDLPASVGPNASPELLASSDPLERGDARPPTNAAASA